MFMKEAAHDSFARDFLTLTRPQNSLVALLSLGFGWLLYANFSSQLLVACAVIYFIHTAQTIRNDIVDLETDRINAPNRPLPSGRVSLANAQMFEFGFLLLAIALSLFTGPILFVGVVFFYCIGWLYNEPPYLGSHRPLASIILLVIYFVVVPFTLGIFLSGGAFQTVSILTLLGFSLSRAAVSLFKDFKDTKGDKVVGKKTFLLTYGAEVTTRTAFFLSVVGSGLLLYSLFFISQIQFSLLPVLLVIASVVFGIICRFKALRDPKLGESLFGWIYSNELRLQLVTILLLLWHP